MTDPVAVIHIAARQVTGASLIPVGASDVTVGNTKKLRITGGMRYATLSSVLTISTAMKIYCSVRAAPMARRNLLQEPPNGGNPELLSESSILTPDIFSVAYSPGKSVRVNPVMVSHWLQNNCKIPSMFTLATRDMNKGAIQGILLGAQLLGLDNVVSVMGDEFTETESKLQATVKDFSSTQLIKSINDMNQRLDFKHRFLLHPTTFCVGATIDLSRDWAREIILTKKKIDSGADFILSQPLFNPDLSMKFYEQYIETIGTPIEIPIMWGVQIKTKGSLSFTDVPDWITEDLDLGRSAFDIALQIVSSYQDNGINNFYIVPPIYRGGRRDYESAQAVIEELQ